MYISVIFCTKVFFHLFSFFEEPECFEYATISFSSPRHIGLYVQGNCGQNTLLYSHNRENTELWNSPKFGLLLLSWLPSLLASISTLHSKLPYPVCLRKLNEGFTLLASFHHDSFRYSFPSYSSTCLIPRRKPHHHHYQNITTRHQTRE